MSDRLFTEEELQIQSEKLDLDKERTLARYKPEFDSMKELIQALENYQSKYGKESNVHFEILDLKAKLLKNKESLEDFLKVL
tara:strand:+ start:126 stop:371 length:246 start_codon:yes stop_codon:yes gene_type:complete